MDHLMRLEPDSPLAAHIGEEWELVPLRVPEGWTIILNEISARRLESGLVEVNDSEDLFWARKNPPMGVMVSDRRDEYVWEEIDLDAGWYRDHFRIDVLAPDWDNVVQSHRSTDLDGFVFLLEVMLKTLTVEARPRT